MREIRESPLFWSGLSIFTTYFVTLPVLTQPSEPLIVSTILRMTRIPTFFVPLFPSGSTSIAPPSIHSTIIIPLLPPSLFFRAPLCFLFTPVSIFETLTLKNYNTLFHFHFFLKMQYLTWIVSLSYVCLILGIFLWRSSHLYVPSLYLSLHLIFNPFLSTDFYWFYPLH